MSRITEWTMDHLDTLRSMWADGATFSEIGAVLNRSRSGIAGKVKRLKLPKRGPNHISRVTAENARKRWGDPKAKRPVRTVKAKQERKPPMLLRIVTVPDSVPVPLIERTGCCYPTTAQSPHLFCNMPTSHGDYCEFHLQIMYPKRRAA